MRRMPFGSLPPRVANVVGSFKNSTTSWSSYGRNSVVVLPHGEGEPYILCLVNTVDIAELIRLSLLGLELGLPRTSFHQARILEQYCHNDQEDCRKTYSEYSEVQRG